MLAEVVPDDEDEESRQLSVDNVSQASSQSSTLMSVNTYANVRRDKFADVKWLDEGRNTIEQDKDDAGNHAVARFEPLAVRLVRIQRVVAIIAGGLGLGCVAVALGVLETVLC